jgi:hypothetical protein
MTEAHTGISPVRVNHMNVVVEDFDTSVALFETLYGAQFYADIPRPEWHACVIGIGRALFELFVPREFLVSARYGPHHVGMEYQADMEQVREVIARHGIRLVRDIGAAVHTHPADCHGVAFEFYGDYFHDNEARTGWPPMKPAEYWRDEHPLGLTGLKGCTIVVGDEDGRDFFLSLLAGDVLYDEARPAVSARAVGYQVADAVLELLMPVGDGPLQRELLRAGEGIRSTVFGVRDIDQARRYFAERNVDVVAGAAPGVFGVPAERNRGLLFEFSE